MKIKGKMFSLIWGQALFVGTVMAVIVTVGLLLGGCPATDSTGDPGNNGNTTVTVPGAPNIVSLTPGDGQVTVGWTAPVSNGGATIIGYSIYYSEKSGDGTNGIKVDAGNATEFTVSGLTNVTTYYFVVTATNAAGEGAISGEVSAIPSATASVPGVPTGLTLTPGGGLVTVAWTPPTNNGGALLTGYHVYYSENQGSGTRGTKVDTGNVTEYIVSGLTNGITYYFVVTAANSAGESVASDEQNAVPATVPDIPTGIILTPGVQQVKVVWTAPANNGGSAITGYLIFYSETQGSGKSGTKVDAGDVTEYDVSGLTNGTTYYFVVTAVNAMGESAASDEQSTAPAATVPGAPTIVSLTPGDGQVTIAWTAPANDGGEAITGYNIYYSVSSGDATGGTKVDTGNVTEFVVSNLENGSEYFFMVTAINSVGEGAASVEASTIPSATATVPGVPTGLKLTPGDGQVTVAWTPPTNNGGTPITGYFIYYSETQGSGTGGTQIDAGNVTEYIVSGLTNGTMYYFVLTAANSVGESIATDEENAISPTVPNAPTIVSLTPGNQQVTVAWTAPTFNGGADITGYFIYYSVNLGDGTNGTKVDAGDVTEYVVRGLTNGISYYFTVTAVNEKGESVLSDEQNIAPAATVPGAPTGVILKPIPGEVKVSWTAPEDNGGADIIGYYIYYSLTKGVGKSGTKIDAGNVTEYVVSGLLSYRVYFFTVTAVNSVGESAASGEQRAATNSYPPDAPTITSLTPGVGEVTVTWTAPEYDGGGSITGYNIYYSETQGSGKNGIKINVGTDTSFVVSGLTNGKTYYFIVTAVNHKGDSAASGEKYATPAATYPEVPIGVALTPGNGEVTVKWSAPAFNGGTPITGYFIYYSENSGDGTNGIKVDAGDVTEYIVSGLTNGITYYFWVTATNAVGESIVSDEKYAVPATIPGKPSNVTAQVSGIGEITVSWSAPADNGGSKIIEYRVYWATSAGFIRNLTNSRNTADITNREMVLQNLNVGTEYYFVVVASNLAGESEVSDEVSVRAATVPGYPTVVSAELTANGEITVTWTPPSSDGGSPITEYRVFWSSDSYPIWDIERKYSKATPDGTSTSLVVRVSDGLIPGTEYGFCVSATNAAGEVVIKHVDNDSNYKEATLLTVPDAPTLDSVSLTSTAQQLRVTWTVPVSDGGLDITQYTVYWDTTSGFDIASAYKMIIKNFRTTETLINGLTIGIPYYFVITATNARGEGKASNEISATPAQISSFINALTLTIDSQDYSVTFTGVIASVDINSMATKATVKDITLVADASGLNVSDELSIIQGVTTIPITAGDGSIREHILYFRNQPITITATQLKIIDGSKTDGTKKLPSQFMVFDISTEATVSSQYNVEFLLVKEGSTAPTTLENFRKTVSMHSDRENVFPSADIDVSLAYKSALFPTDKTSLYLAYDSEGNYPLEQNTSYTLYAVQPQSTDSNPVSLGNYTTGSIVNLGSAIVDGPIESPTTASVNGKYFMTREQFLVFFGMVGFEITTELRQLKGDSAGDPIITNTKKVLIEEKIWFSDKISTSKPGWYAIAFKPNRAFYNDTAQHNFVFEIEFRVTGNFTFNFID